MRAVNAPTTRSARANGNRHLLRSTTYTRCLRRLAGGGDGSIKSNPSLDSTSSYLQINNHYHYHFL